MGLGGIFIDDDQINAAFQGTSFGCAETVYAKKQLVADAIMKRTCDYSTGSTMSAILQELGLTKTLHGNPTKAARRWMYEVKKGMVDEMVNRFLGWKLPEDFCPDDGISFEREHSVEYMAKQGKPPLRHEPIGTNLFTAGQAKAMVKHMLGLDS